MRVPDTALAGPQAFATWAHEGQTRLTSCGPVPYLEHPRAVVGLLQQGGITDPDTLAAGWLHDTVEDQCERLSGVADPALGRPRALGLLAGVFGAGVARIVAEVTNPLTTDYTAHIERLVAQGSPAALSVKIADHLDNTAALDRQPGDQRTEEMLVKLRARYAAVRPLLRGARSLFDADWQAEKLAEDLT